MEICDKVYALERDAKRSKILETRIAKANQTGNITCLNQDFLETKIPHQEQVNFIICDPSCSGSGMKLHGNETTDCTKNMATPQDQIERVKNLSKFQYKILSHALEYANNEKTRLRYVCYSTCSIYKEEDEDVVKDILKKFGEKWEIPTNLAEIIEKVFQVKKGEKTDQKEKFMQGMHVSKYGVRICPSCSKGRLNGFFCAIFQRKDFVVKK